MPASFARGDRSAARRPLAGDLAATRRAFGAGAVGAVVSATGAAAVTNGRPALVPIVVAAQTGLLVGWLGLLRPPTPAGVAAIALAAATAADVSLLSPGQRSLGRLVGVGGLALLAAVLQQLLRRRRVRVTEGLAATMTAVVLVGMLAELFALAVGRAGRAAVAATLVAVAAALLVGRLPVGRSGGWPGVLSHVVVGLAAGTLGGLAYTGIAGPLAIRTGALLGLTAAGLAVAADLAVAAGLATMADAGPRSAFAVQALLPLAAAAPAAYAAGRLLVG